MSTQPSTIDRQPATLIARCKWCVNRIGGARYRLDGVWQTVFSIHHFVGDGQFTDGICPECKAAILAIGRADIKPNVPAA